MTKPDDEDVIQQTESADETASQHLQIHIRRKLPGRRLDKYLHGRLPNLSRTAVQRLIKEGSVKVNGQETKPSYEMAGGDCIVITLPAPTPRELIAENIPLDILYEDEYLIAINKRAGIICHPARGDQSGTIANALMYYLQTKISRGDDPTRPGIVHRLDKNTTGVMLCAKQDEAHWRLSL
ncbi:MAG: RluA family pseudouridine synthase, partial [Phycisphaerales bacterium]|nr:RluA family pseudouridine synthase [Phycisphaerales bacterium]